VGRADVKHVEHLPDRAYYPSDVDTVDAGHLLPVGLCAVITPRLTQAPPDWMDRPHDGLLQGTDNRKSLIAGREHISEYCAGLAPESGENGHRG
jgi:hypothetical protein